MPRNIEASPNNFFPENLISPVEIQRPVGVDLFYSDLAEAQIRRDLSAQAANIFDRVPDVHLDLSQAVDQKLISVDEVSQFYSDLSDFISSDSNHSRLILYLPFQLLPQAGNLTSSQHKFVQSYQNAWIQLLFESDIRSDFVDGDILEPGLGDLPRVRKAAHLVPELLKKGITNTELIQEIIDINNQDEELKSSLSEGLSVNNTVTLVKDNSTFDLTTFTDRLSQIDKKYSPTSGNISSQSIVQKYNPKFLPDSKISPERALWEKSIKREEVINQAVLQIVDLKTIDLLFTIDSTDSAYKILGLKSIFNQNHLIPNFDSLIKKHWHDGDNQIKNTIVTGLSCWYKNKIISQDYLDSFGVKIPDLSSPFPVNLDHLISVDFKNLSQAIDKIKNNSELSEYLYPVFLTFGSKVKGYSKLDSDQDIAVIFKPHTAIEKRDSLLKLIKDIPELKDIDKFSEIWTTQKDNQISFRSFSQVEWGIITPQEVHCILGAVWVGDSSQFQKIRHDFFQQYLDLSRFDSQKDQIRSYFLRQLENDFLQCRLMHKGYHSFYPNQISADFFDQKSIDGQSAFWDPGFRRVATQLFLSRVFLPDLSK